MTDIDLTAAITAADYAWERYPLSNIKKWSTK